MLVGALLCNRLLMFSAQLAHQRSIVFSHSAIAFCRALWLWQRRHISFDRWLRLWLRVLWQALGHKYVVKFSFSRGQRVSDRHCSGLLDEVAHARTLLLCKGGLSTALWESSPRSFVLLITLFSVKHYYFG
jgi:hypothetical protein